MTKRIHRHIQEKKTNSQISKNPKRKKKFPWHLLKMWDVKMILKYTPRKYGFPFVSSLQNFKKTEINSQQIKYFKSTLKLHQ